MRPVRPSSRRTTTHPTGTRPRARPVRHRPIFLYWYGDHRDLHSFPTRRSSDLVWDEVYERLAQLIAEHRTTLVFVNTRKLCERLAMHLSERLGAEHVTSHHGSLSKEKRLEAEKIGRAHV